MFSLRYELNSNGLNQARTEWRRRNGKSPVPGIFWRPVNQEKNFLHVTLFASFAIQILNTMGPLASKFRLLR